MDKRKSMNLETGMLEDIEDVRRLVLQLTELLDGVLTYPLLPLIMPPSARADYAALTAAARTMVRQTSEADYSRDMFRMAGRSVSEAERVVVNNGLSETLPVTHPSLHRGEGVKLDPNDPVVRSSVILSQYAREQQQNKVQQEEAPTRLPEDIEEFLKMVSDTEEMLDEEKNTD